MLIWFPENIKNVRERNLSTNANAGMSIRASDKYISFSTIITFGLLLLLISCASTSIRNEGIIAEAPIDEYAGSKACADCHMDKYEDWSQRLMSSFVRYRKDSPGPLPGDWSASPVNEKDIFIIVGKRRKVAFVDKDWKVIPYEYLFKKEKWKKRDGWAKGNYDYRLRCGLCHTVGLNPETRQFKELNVGCESCHGPGSRHVEDPEIMSIKVPGRTDGHNVLFTCRKCHNERKKHARAIKGFSGHFHKSE